MDFHPDGASEACFKQMLEQFPYGIVLSDKQRRVTWINRNFSQMCGYEFHELLGMCPATLLQGAETDPVTSLEMKESLDADKPCHVQILNYHKNGSTYWADICICPVYGDQEEVEFYFGVSRDVTLEREKSEGINDYLMMLYNRLSRVMGYPVPD
ncbi:MAG: PAS domain-containing protein [Verrucomicrobiota bacterium]